MPDRAVTPVVEKLLVLGIVAVFVGGMTVALFGTAIPEYRSAAGAEVGERVLASATLAVERSVPPNATAVRATRRVDLPGTIRGSGYVLRVESRSLVLEHPDPAVGGRNRLALRPSVTTIRGRWQSGAETVVVVSDAPGGLEVELREGDP